MKTVKMVADIFLTAAWLVVFILARVLGNSVMSGIGIAGVIVFATLSVADVARAKE